MNDYLIPLAMVLLGLVAVALYVVTAALRQATNRLADMNEQLLILAGLAKEGPEAARALVAARKAKARPEPIKQEMPKKPKDGITMTYGTV